MPEGLKLSIEPSEFSAYLRTAYHFLIIIQTTHELAPGEYFFIIHATSKKEGGTTGRKYYGQGGAIVEFATRVTLLIRQYLKTLGTDQPTRTDRYYFLIMTTDSRFRDLAR